MTEVTYAIVFSGEILDGFQTISVKSHMAKLLKADAEKMATLFSGRPIVIKRTHDKAEATKYGVALKKIGADVKLMASKTKTAAKPIAAAPDAVPSTPATQPAATAPQPAAGPARPRAVVAPPRDVALTTTHAPVLRDIDPSMLTVSSDFDRLSEPLPPPAPIPDEFGNFTVSEDLTAPLIPGTPFMPADIDVSRYTLRDNDGTPLFEPRLRNDPRIDAPDYELNEPGVLLGQLRDHHALVYHADFEFTLAEPGADLSDPSTRRQTGQKLFLDLSQYELVPLPVVEDDEDEDEDD